MTKRHAIELMLAATIVLLFASNLEGQGNSTAEEKAPLRLVQTIPMPGVQGRLDH
jgi:hypothetical protein